MALSKKQKRERSLKRANRDVNVLRLTKKLLQSSDLILPCVDVEAFEFAQDQVLEIGVSYIDLKQLTVRNTDHYIIAQYQNRRNGKYVCDNKDNFDFGESKIIRMVDLAKELSSTFRPLSAISAFGTKEDCGYLTDCNIHVPSKNIDVHTLYELYCPPINGSPISLKRLSEQFGHHLEHPHNAGNDAHVTALCLVDIIKYVQDNYDTLLNKALCKLEKLNESVHS